MQLYQTMPETLKDEITHVCVLNACSHSGLVDQARSIYAKIDVKSVNVVTTMVIAMMIQLTSTCPSNLG